MPSIRASRLAFSYGDAVPILSDVSFHVPEGLTGLVGENGAGKSTLLRLVASELTPTSGAIRVEPRGALVVLCPQDVERPGGDVLERLAHGVWGSRLMAMLRLHAVDVERWGTLSAGERRRWQLGAALAREPDVLLLDEPTNHLDSEARALVVAALRTFSATGLVVSHDRELLDALTDRTVRVVSGSARLYRGSYGRARALWEQEEAEAWSALTAAQEAVRAAARRLVDARQVQAPTQRSRSGTRRMRGPRDSDGRAAGGRAARAEARAGRRVETLRRAAERAAAADPGSPGDGHRRAFGLRHLGARAEAVAPRARGAGGPRRRPRAAPRRPAPPRAQRPRPDQRAERRRQATLLRALLAGATVPPERILHLPQGTREHGVRPFHLTHHSACRPS